MKSSKQSFPICQSCGMPMQNPDDFGTNADKSRNHEYCCYCWQMGDFTAKMSLEDFIDKQVKIGVEKFGLSRDEARAIAQSTLPKLKRWQS
jgi:hypothetical protein